MQASLAIGIDVLPMFLQNPVFVFQNFPDNSCVDIEPFPKFSSTFAIPRPINDLFLLSQRQIFGRFALFSDISAIFFFDFVILNNFRCKISQLFKEEKSIWSKIVRLTHR
jgi:hypothetical protein